MATIAFVCMGAPGHFFPTLPIVRELTRRGETVLYFIPERWRPLVEAAGAIWRPYASVIMAAEGPRPKRRVGATLMQDAPAIFARDIAAALPPLVEELAQQRPDLLVCDTYAFAGHLAGEHLGISTIRSSPTYLLSDDLNYYKSEGSGALGIIQSSIERYNDIMDPLFARYELPRRSFIDMRLAPARADIVYVSRSFHPGADRFGESVLFVGPSLYPGARPFGERVNLQAKPYGALVYVSFGTVFAHDPMFYYLCIEALASVNARVVMQVGEHLARQLAEDLPANFVVTPPVAQLEVLERADLFITHAGMGGTMEALHYGVPMLAIPQLAEQSITARRIQELGAGLTLKREELSIAALRESVTLLLNDCSYRSRAKALGDDARKDGGYLRASDRVQEILRASLSR